MKLDEGSTISLKVVTKGRQYEHVRFISTNKLRITAEDSGMSGELVIAGHFQKEKYVQYVASRARSGSNGSKQEMRDSQSQVLVVLLAVVQFFVKRQNLQHGPLRLTRLSVLCQYLGQKLNLEVKCIY